MSDCSRSRQISGCLGLNFFILIIIIIIVIIAVRASTNTHLFKLHQTWALISAFSSLSLRNYRQIFFLLVSSFSFGAEKAVVSVALTGTSFISSSAQLTFLKKKTKKKLCLLELVTKLRGSFAWQDGFIGGLGKRQEQMDGQLRLWAVWGDIPAYWIVF